MIHFQLILFVVLSNVANFSWNFVNAQYDDQNQFFGQPVPNETPAPIDIESDNAMIKYDLEKISLNIAVNEKLTIRNTGVSIEAIVNETTETTLRQGPFGDKTFIYHMIIYYWSGNTSGPAATTVDKQNGTAIEAISYWYNQEYDTFENSLKYRDGCASISTRIRVGTLTNDKFQRFIKKLKRIPNAGDSTSIPHGFTFDWFNNFSTNSTYYAYPSSYTDEKSGMKYYCNTLCALESTISTISREQFEESFGSLKNSQGDPLTNSVSQYPPDGRPIIKAKGLSTTFIL